MSRFLFPLLDRKAPAPPPEFLGPIGGPAAPTQPPGFSAGGSGIYSAADAYHAFVLTARIPNRQGYAPARPIRGHGPYDTHILTAAAQQEKLPLRDRLSAFFSTMRRAGATLVGALLTG